MDQFADDLAALLDQLDLSNAVLVGSSMGGGEVVRYLARHGSQRVDKAVLVGSMPPLMLKTDSNPDGVPIEIFDGHRKSVTENRAQFYQYLAIPYYGYNRAGSHIAADLREDFWRLGMMGGLKGQVDCIKAFSETDLTEDLKKIDIPVLILHGDDDQMVPLDFGARRMAKLLLRARLKIYPGGDHGLAQTHPDQVNADILDFIKRR
jgi:non-heme chloroperoxidase